MGIRRPVPHSVAWDQVIVVHLLVQIFAFRRMALVDGSAFVLVCAVHVFSVNFVVVVVVIVISFEWPYSL